MRMLIMKHILDIFAEILKEEAAGNVIIHRYNEIDPDEQKMHANYLRDHIDDPLYAECRNFISRYFSSLWD